MSHLFFDLDRTLWHHERNHELLFDELHRHFQWPGSARDWVRAYLRINDRLWDHIQGHNLGVDYVRVRRFPLLFQEMNLTMPSVRSSEFLAAECEALLKEVLPDMGAGYEGVFDAFNELRLRGHHVHLITNGVFEPQQRKVIALGIEAMVDVLMTSDLAGAYKPEKGIFMAALKAAGARAGESWMIGDSLLRDVLGGQGVGMRTAWFRAKDALPPDAVAIPDFEFSEWSAFPRLLTDAECG